MRIESAEERQSMQPPTDWDDIDLYRFFGLALGPPNEERFAWLKQAELPDALSSLWNYLGCEGEFPGFENFDTYGHYEAGYIALFDVGMPEPPVPLFESAHEKSVPAQELALENTYFYDVLNLRSSAYSTPDHIFPQLEFAAAVRYARENSSDEENRLNLARLERDFIDRHLLNWLPIAYEKLSSLNPPVYSLMFALLIAFLGRQRQMLDQAAPGNFAAPPLPEAPRVPRSKN